MEGLTSTLLLVLFIGSATCQTVNDCPAGVPRDANLRVFGDSCFQFELAHVRTHTLARQACESNGGHLALVKSQAIQDFLHHALTNDYGMSYSKFWIGLNDLDNENEFMWEDGTPLTYSNWISGSGPNGTSWNHAMNHNEDDCVTIDLETDGKWAEYPCDASSLLIFFSEAEEHLYICQYKLAPSGTTSALVSGNPGTTVVVQTNPCPAFSCNLDCGTKGFQKDATSGCSICQCAA